MPKLYVVPTPIGNLEDITLRALRILKESSLILAEDTRKTAILLGYYDIQNKVVSYHKFNEHKTVKSLVERIKTGEQVALVSDAGTPAISDPGFLLVRACLQNDIDIETLPGATAFVPALVNSGLPCERFFFEGFLPVKKGKKSRLMWLSKVPASVIIYESPYRLVKTLTLLSDFFSPQRLASVSRELSKIYEENKRGTLNELIQYYTKNTPKGEIVIIVDGAKS